MLMVSTCVAYACGHALSPIAVSIDRTIKLINHILRDILTTFTRKLNYTKKNVDILVAIGSFALQTYVLRPIFRNKHVPKLNKVFCGRYPSRKMSK